MTSIHSRQASLPSHSLGIPLDPYLQQPFAVFGEVRRVLVHGAPFIVSFSNRCFPTKAVAIWRSLDTNGHVALAKLYLERTGFTDIVANLLTDGTAGDPLVAVVDPVPQP